MPGYNHYSWCMCGWCYKTGSNGYSAKKQQDYVDHQSAGALLAHSGANRSYSACFVVPNAKCPVCGESVYYYQNDAGSRVFFDELGWPWPKHPCTDSATKIQPLSTTPRARTTKDVLEIVKAAQQLDFDPAVKFRFSFGDSPWDLLCVESIRRSGFENRVEARSISPLLDQPLYLAFVSAKIVPVVGDFFGFDGESVSVLEAGSLQPKRLKARLIEEVEFSIGPKGEGQ
jgi:hypothetical protein